MWQLTIDSNVDMDSLKKNRHTFRFPETENPWAK